MRLTKRSSTSAALAICVVLPMFYYNIFHLMSNVKLKSKVYGQTVYYNKVDNQDKGINSDKKSNTIKKLDNYTDNNYKENDSYRDESDESEVLLVKYNFIDSGDNIINEDYSTENDNIKENNIESNRNRDDNNKIDNNEGINNKLYKDKINVDYIEKSEKVKKIKDDIRENNKTTTNIHEINTNNTKEKPSNNITENESNLENLNVNYRTNTTGKTKIEEKYDEAHKNNTEDKVRNIIAELGEQVDTINIDPKTNAEEKLENHIIEKDEKANNKNSTEEKIRNDITEKSEKIIETINVNPNNNTVKQASNEITEKPESIKTIKANPKNDTEEKVGNDIKENAEKTETINANYKNITEKKVRNAIAVKVEKLNIDPKTNAEEKNENNVIEKVETINANHKNNTEAKVRNNITEKSENKIETINVNPKNYTEEKASNGIKEKDENIETVKANHKNNTEENGRNDIKENAKITETINANYKNITEKKVSNAIAEKVKKLNIDPKTNAEEKIENKIIEKVETINANHKNYTEEKVRNNITEKSEKKIETINVNPKNYTEEKASNGIKEKDENIETVNANHKNNTEENGRNDIKENAEITETINVNYKNNTKKKARNDIIENNEKMEPLNVNPKNNTAEKVRNDITENDKKIETVSANPKNNIEEKLRNNEKSNITNEKDIKLLLLDHDNVTTLRAINEPDKDFILKTPGCVIPDYGKTMIFNEAASKGHTCGIRAVFIHKADDDEVIFRIDEKKMNEHKKGNQTYECCYKYVSRPITTKPGIQDTEVTYSPCELFKNGTKIKLKQEVIAVTCGNDPVKRSKIIYEDVYIIVKKVKKDEIKVNKRKSWNVLIVGMDTMSRARAYKNMPLTMQYFQEHDWLDYRGYQKVGYNTFPNLMALLTGKMNVYSACRPSMDHCNDLFIWAQYRNASYATAYGEDFLTLPDTFKNYGGFEIPPTDHYMRPFYLTGEHVAGNLVCTKQLPSAVHMLEYANHLAQTYKDKNFFGMFWINSYSHNDFNNPALFDQHTRHFFEELPMTGALNNTFIIFLSDHGIRYGEMRYSVESYYEERLPMFYMWVPYEFRKDHTAKYNSLKVNEHRLTTPYDLHATLWEILKMSRDSVTVIKPEACPNCTSLFEEKSVHRTCAEAAVDKKWCSCHKLEPVDTKDAEGKHCLELAVSSIQNISKDIKTIECTRCSTLQLKKALRIHSYYDNANNKTYFIVAFLLSPGNVGYEVTIEKNNGGYNIVTPTTTITAYNTKGDCTVKKLTDRPYCVCENIPKCHKKPKR